MDNDISKLVIWLENKIIEDNTRDKNELSDNDFQFTRGYRAALIETLAYIQLGLD